MKAETGLAQGSNPCRPEKSNLQGSGLKLAFTFGEPKGTQGRDSRSSPGAHFCVETLRGMPTSRLANCSKASYTSHQI